MKTLKSDDRARITAAKAVSLVVMVAVGGIIAAFLVPVAVNEIEGNTTTTLTQSVGNDYEVNPKLVSNVTSVAAGTPDTATVELNDTRTSTTVTKTIDNGSTADYDLEGGTVTVGIEDVNTSPSPSEATANYTYSNDYAFSSSASSLWSIIGLAIILAVVLFFVAVGLRAHNKM